ncbi:MAG: hypothetical protein OXH23_02140 [bacterium]|nr:hypothetical protein [bacterium]
MDEPVMAEKIMLSGSDHLASSISFASRILFFRGSSDRLLRAEATLAYPLLRYGLRPIRIIRSWSLQSSVLPTFDPNEEPP